ncbi:probable ubiquitin-conjugating enzyme E2 37 isoform X1 [Gossypium raimondii]|uniref:UBC core domain-containing protein n=1 Tax=Gossypium raimondii TaxID=29730 RepID=A0A0D2SDM0_GOSRA|nr:probable ubiquitin-conjugating enzyme E2 37 isoform X1 [Gossypium raimondii]KJB29305.1 hypothetical protein B456_005G101300 [Gossypium raimondii]
MAQEARLKLRMQKELKLLLVDPPHGASFPTLSSQSNITDLSSIHAQICLEETFYSKGIFKIKVQIPKRYPLQLPIVTFGTPVYCSNIDNGDFLKIYNKV